jgi:hypothetical protein
MAHQKNNRQLAWITGANGLIGNYLVQTAPRFAPRWRIIGIVGDGNMPSLLYAGRDAVSASPNSFGNVRYRQLDLATRAGRVVEHRQNPEGVVRSTARFDRMARGKFGRNVLRHEFHELTRTIP